MPCHVPSTSAPKLRRSPLLPLKLSSSAVVFDLTDPVQRQMRDALERFHTGRRPRLKAHAMRQVGSVIYELATWEPHSPRSQHVLVTWSWDKHSLGLCFPAFPTRGAAREAFRAAIAGKPAAGSAAPATAAP